MSATTTYDFADRPAVLNLQQDGRETPLVQAATYLPSGPLASLALGNGITETRGFDARYFPQAVTAARESALLDFDYSVDPVGNVTAIADGLDPQSSRTFAYQDGTYFLTQADGPWGDLSWTYDRIGNRLTQTRDSATDTYSYLPSGSGNSPLLDSIALSGSGSADYTWGPAGHLEVVARGANVIDFSWDDAGRLAASTRAAGNAAADFLYDGRSFLAHAEATQGSDDLVEPTYASEGILAHRAWTGIRPRGVGGANVELTADDYVLTFADRPLALLSQVVPTTATFNDVSETHTFWRYVEQMVLFGVTSGCGGGNYCPNSPVNRAAMAAFLTRTFDLGLTWLTADHLGTPALATNRAARTTWSGGFEPFGADWLAGTPAGASENGVFLRLPGQWEDPVWIDATLGANLYYNVHRWYEAGTGRYTRKDPVGDVERRQDGPWHPRVDIERFSLYTYVDANPLAFIDPLGLLKFKGCTPDEQNQISRTFKEYCSKIEQQDFNDCIKCEGPKLPGKLKGLGDKDNRTVRCKDDRTGRCSAPEDQVGCAWAIPLGRTIRLCPDAWTPSCGPLGCTLIHEMTHQLGFLGEKKPGAVEKCLGC